MKKTSSIILLFLIITCFSCEQKTDKKENIVSIIDSIPKKEKRTIFSGLKPVYYDALKIHRLKPLNENPNIEKGFRFVFMPRFGGTFYFFEINYSDSTLRSTEFTKKRPDGVGENVITKENPIIKLKYEDFDELEYLINNSMFWTLESEGLAPRSFDPFNYMYEAKQLLEEMYEDFYKPYHLVMRCNPQNREFLLLGEYIKKLAGQPNFYKELKPKPFNFKMP